MLYEANLNPAIQQPLLAAPEPSWYALCTRSRHEKIVECELRSKQIDHYLPVFEESHQWKDRKKLVQIPVFPGYVFARFLDEASARLAVLRTTGVVRILGYGGGIQSIPSEQIDAVRRLLVNRGRCLAHPLLREGVAVRVRRGPLKGIDGLLLRMKNQTRLVVSIQLLSQSVSTEMDASDVEALPTKRPM